MFIRCGVFKIFRSEEDTFPHDIFNSLAILCTFMVVLIRHKHSIVQLIAQQRFIRISLNVSENVSIEIYRSQRYIYIYIYIYIYCYLSIMFIVLHLEFKKLNF
jgi:hypothetical protein